MAHKLAKQRNYAPETCVKCLPAENGFGYAAYMSNAWNTTALYASCLIITRRCSGADALPLRF